MATTKKPTGRAASVQAGLCIGNAASLMFTITGAALLAEMISREIVRWESVGYWVMGILLVASFMGAWIAIKQIKRRKILISQFSALLFFVMLMAITALFFGGQYDAVAVTALLVWGGSSTAGLLGIKEKKHDVSRKAHKRHR